jgi:hypothetical protein
MKKITAIILMAVLVLALTACGGGEHSGTWEGRVMKDGEDNEFLETLVLSGKNFTLTQYNIEASSHRNPSAPPAENTGAVMAFVDHNQHMSWLHTENEFENKKTVSDWSDVGEIRITEFELVQVVAKGTFSVTDGKIEFVLSDNTVRVFDLEATENTMRINGINFIRSGMNR